MGKIKTVKYKTNIDCIACIDTVRKILDAEKKVDYWYVDPVDEDHTLTLIGEDLPIEKITTEIHKAGFNLARV